MGKVVLLSFVVAPILAKNLEREPFGKVVRQLFPAYYVLGMAAAAGGLLSVTALAIIRESQSLAPHGRGNLADDPCRRNVLPVAADSAEQCHERSAQGTGTAWTR